VVTLRRATTTLLDALGLLLLAGAAAAAAWPASRALALAAAGAVVLSGSWLAAWLADRADKDDRP
jgi:hypothetical protein